MEAQHPKESAILVVEDDFLKARLIVASLQNHIGTRKIHVARDGDAAFRMIQEHDPDVILLNMNLSRPSGMEFLRLLSQDGNGMNETRIVAMTQLGQGDLRTAASTLGARYFVETPYAPADLSSKIVEAIRGGRP